MAAPAAPKTPEQIMADTIANHPVFGRQNNTYNAATQNRVVHIVGCGSLGSYIGLLLAKLGIKNFVLWDSDSVAQHNVANQAFGNDAVGRKKTEELERIIRANSTWTTATRNVVGPPRLTISEEENFTENSIIADEDCVIFSVADSITPRQLVYNNTQNNVFIIDARTGSEYGQMFCCDKSVAKDRKQYEQFAMVLPPGGAEDGDCGMQSIAYSTAAVATMAVNSYIRFVNKQPYPHKLDFDFPSYDLMLFKSNGEVKA